MSDLSHTHGHGHGHVHGHQPAYVPPTTTPTTTTGKTKVTTHKTPQPVTDTVSPAGSTTNISAGGSALYYSGSPILAAPGIEGMSSASLMEVVGKALDKHRQRQIHDSVKLDPSNVPELGERKDVYTTEKTTTDSNGKQQTETVTTVVTTTTVQNNVLGRIADTLTDDIFQAIKKHSKMKGHSLTLNQMQAFVQQALMSGALLSIMPALDLLQVPGHPPSFLTEPTAAGVANAVSFANIIARSGPFFEEIGNKVFPHDSEKAANLAEAVKEAFTGIALQKLGSALSLPGLGKQVVAQAAVTRSESNILQTPSFARAIVPKLTTLVVQTAGLSRTESQKIINKVLDQVASEGDFNTRQEILTALQNAFKKAFPNQPQLADQLAARVEQDALEAALSSSGGTYAVQFNPLKLNVATITDDIKNSILKEFADSERALHAEEVAADIASSIKKAAINGQLQSEQAVRDAIQSELIAAGYPAGEAGHIAAVVNLGLPAPEPLLNPNSSGLLSPADFTKSVHDALLSNHIPPHSALGQAILSSLGISDKPASTNMIGLINEGHKSEQAKGPNLLLLNPSRQAIQQELDFLDPGTQIVISWSTVMNGSANREDYKRTSNNTV